MKIPIKWCHYTIIQHLNIFILYVRACNNARMPGMPLPQQNGNEIFSKILFPDFMGPEQSLTWHILPSFIRHVVSDSLEIISLYIFIIIKIIIISSRCLSVVLSISVYIMMYGCTYETYTMHNPLIHLMGFSINSHSTEPT